VCCYAKASIRSNLRQVWNSLDPYIIHTPCVVTHASRIYVQHHLAARYSSGTGQSPSIHIYAPYT